MDNRKSNCLTLIQEPESLKSIISVTQVDITATTLTDVTGLAVQLEAGKSYRIKAALLCNDRPDILGWKVGASYGGGALSAVVMSGRSFTIPGILAVNVSRDVGTILDASTVNVSPTKIEIDGLIETISANTLTIQLAETTGSRIHSRCMADQPLKHLNCKWAKRRLGEFLRFFEPLPGINPRRFLTAIMLLHDAPRAPLQRR